MTDSNIYIRHVYEKFPGQESPDTFIGPFPTTDLAVQHRLVYGPLSTNSSVVRVDGTPDPEHTMTPGQAVDYTLQRY